MANRELMVAREYPDVAPAVERIFRHEFPTLELLDFNAMRAGDGIHIANYHWISFSGAETELLKLGLIEMWMVPIRPKRRAYFGRGGKDGRDGNSGWVWRLAKNRLSVHLILNEPLDRTHPLAALAPWNWPFTASCAPPRPSFLRMVVNNEVRT